MENILGSKDKITVCQLLINNKIDYFEIEIKLTDDPNYPKLSDLFQKEFSPVYINPTKNYYIYSVQENCPFLSR